MKRAVALTLALGVLLAACATAPVATAVPPTVPPKSAPAARTLTVFAAASLTQAFGDIGKAFEAINPRVSVTFNFAGSQTLQAQIEAGAPVDVFASASGTNMDAVVTGGYVDKTAPQVFLTNKLVVILPPNNPANVQTLADLGKARLKLDLAADTVPAGKYARQILNNMSEDPTYGTDFGSKVLANVISNETDIRQVVGKVQLGEADAGIVYVSDLSVAPTLGAIEIPDSVNVVAKYSIAPLIKAPNPDLAAQFVAYVLSTDGQATLKQWGFGPIQ
jgi:molybdate transport system substrate-binding protein